MQADVAHPYPVHFFVPGKPYKIAGMLSQRACILFGVEAPGRFF